MYSAACPDPPWRSLILHLDPPPKAIFQIAPGGPWWACPSIRCTSSIDFVRYNTILTLLWLLWCTHAIDRLNTRIVEYNSHFTAKVRDPRAQSWS